MMWGRWLVRYREDSTLTFNVEMNMKEVRRTDDYIELLHEPSGTREFLYTAGGMVSRTADGFDTNQINHGFGQWVQQGPK
jgi:hypothetical protein